MATNGAVMEVMNDDGFTGAEALVAQGMSIVRLENNTQMQVAVQRPRDESKILASALKELELYPSMAEEAIYSKPVGRNDAGKMTYAEGLSIRTAESLANRWVNSSYGCEIVGETETAILLAAVFLDYENNVRHVLSGRVSKYYKPRNSNVSKPRSADNLDLAVKAEQSKLLREVILRSLPPGLRMEYENKARVMLKTDKIENRRKAIIARFEEHDVEVDTLEKHLNKKVDTWTHNDIINLLGIANALRDGELTKEGAFPGIFDDKDKKEADKSATESANKGEVINAGGKQETITGMVEEGQEKAKEQEQTAAAPY